MAADFRQTYHTHIKFLVRERLLSPQLIKQIPRTNVHRWKQEATDKYCTLGLNLAGTKEYELIKAFAEHRKARKIFASYIRIVKTFALIAHDIPKFQHFIKENRKKVLQVIQRVKSTIGLRTSLRFFNISLATYRQWSLESTSQCFQSIFNACNRIYPNQLANGEMIKLKELLLDPSFQYWPISSIAHYSRRLNLLPLSLNTWYKYAHKLGVMHHKHASRRKKNTISVRADRPNQIWHADITSFITGDNVRHFIYLVVDNFSRKILACHVADSVIADIRRFTIEQALKNVNDNPITLITDGGPENNLKVHLNAIDQLINHKIALVDVHYSNSLIEAHNKLLKYNYLYKMNIADGENLKKVFQWVVSDFNNRPHVSLGGATPSEKYENVSLNLSLLKQYTQQATAARKTHNASHRCSHC